MNNEAHNINIKKDNLDIFSQWASIFSSIFIPILISILAVYGNSIINKAEIKEKRLEMSIIVLSTKFTDIDVQKELRRWAVSNIESATSVKFSEKTNRYLSENGLSIYSESDLNNLREVLSTPLDGARFKGD